jgi:membrane protease YdiL (CAAX protease family)
VTKADDRPRISPTVALLFQGGIGALGLAAIMLFGIPVQNTGVTPGLAVLLGLVGSAATYAVIVFLTRPTGLLHQAMARELEALSRFTRDYSWPVLITLSVFAGVGEELLFRGAIQGWLAQHAPDALAIAVASLLFGLVHYLSLAYFCLATGMGLLLGIAYTTTDSLLLVMVWHGVYDMIALFSLRRHPHLFGAH